METVKAMATKFWNGLWDDKFYKHEALILIILGMVIARIF